MLKSAIKRTFAGTKSNVEAMKQIGHALFPVMRDERRWKRFLGDTALAFFGTLLVTGIIFALRLYPRIQNISLVYLLVVLALASTRGLYAAVFSSVVAFLSFDYFLVQPLFTFTIARVEDWLALFVFLATAIITGQLAAALRQRAEQARRREYEARKLYELVRDTTREQELEHQLRIIARSVVDAFAAWGVVDCAIILPDEKHRPVLEAGARPVRGDGGRQLLLPDEAATAAWVLAQGQTAELHDVKLAPSSGINPRAVVRSTTTGQHVRRYIRMVPLMLGTRVVGVLRLSMEDDARQIAMERKLGVDREHTNPHTAFFWAFVDQAAAVIERERLRRENLQVEVLQRTDSLRAALLSSASHDLRTPLASIKAAASSLLEEDVQWDDEARHSIAVSIVKEADRLNRLVANLLDMSRIEGGALNPEKEWYPVDELIHDVLGRMQPLLQGRAIHTDLPDDLPPVELDYLQIDQVLTNLLENAVRYTPAGTPIDMAVRLERDEVVVSVADRGPGIPQADLERVFDKFYRVMETEIKSTRVTGSGLGLAVCRGLVEAHGGRIWAENREGGGAVFRFTLPLRRDEGKSIE
jgi:two-component system, OmpR family, sensor histidine kinase KdpD